MEHEIMNDFNLDAIKDNFKPPKMTVIEMNVAEELVERLGLSYEDLKKYIYSNGEILDKKFYWTKEVCDFIKKH